MRARVSRWIEPRHRSRFVFESHRVAHIASSVGPDDRVRRDGLRRRVRALSHDARGVPGGRMWLDCVPARPRGSLGFSSDYPHEADFVDVNREIEETLESGELSDTDKRAILGENALKFFRF